MFLFLCGLCSTVFQYFCLSVFFFPAAYQQFPIKGAYIHSLYSDYQGPHKPSKTLAKNIVFVYMKTFVFHGFEGHWYGTAWYCQVLSVCRPSTTVAAEFCTLLWLHGEAIGLASAAGDSEWHGHGHEKKPFRRNRLG